MWFMFVNLKVTSVVINVLVLLVASQELHAFSIQCGLVHGNYIKNIY